MSQYKGEATTRAFVDWIVAPGVSLFLLHGLRSCSTEQQSSNSSTTYTRKNLGGLSSTTVSSTSEPTHLYPDEKEFIERVKRDRLEGWSKQAEQYQVVGGHQTRPYA